MANRLISIFRFLFRRQKMEQDLDAELRYHIDRLTEQHVARGKSSDNARRQAMIDVGGVEPTKEECRDVRLGRLADRPRTHRNRCRKQYGAQHTPAS